MENSKQPAESREKTESDRHARLLTRLSAALTTHADPERSLAEVASLATMAWADVVFVDLARRVVIRETSASLDETSVRAAHAVLESQIARALRRRVEETGEAEQTTSVILAPMTIRGRVLGVLSAVRHPRREPFASEDLGLLRELARRAARIIDHGHLCRDAEEKQRSQEQFLATVSHELRTPLTAILGWSHMLQGSTLDAETQKKALESIERNARTQARLIEELLDLSRALAGHLRLSLSPISLPLIVSSVIDTFRPGAAARGVELRASIDPRAPMMLGDAQRIRQIVWHVISNAVKFTAPEGTIEIQVGFDARNLSLEVRDDGEGMSASFLPRAFDLFSQADPSSTRRHGGLGIGLTMVRELTRMHGGRVEAMSEGEGRGARFIVRFPALARSSERSLKKRAMPRDEQLGLLRPGALRGVRVLVFDPEPEVLAVVATVLGLCGAEVRARRAVEPLEFARFCPDVLVSSLEVPEYMRDIINVSLERPVEPQDLVDLLRRALFRAA